MKKKMLSPDALAALAKGTQLHAAETPAAGADGGEGVNPSDSATGVDAGATGVEETAGEAVETAETTASEEVTELTAKITDITSQLEASTTKVTELEAKLLELEATVATADAKVAAAAEESAEYRAIVEGQFAAMRIHLGLSAVDTKNWSNGALLREYAATAESFEKSLPEGSQVPENAATEHKAPIVSSLVAGSFDQLGF